MVNTLEALRFLSKSGYVVIHNIIIDDLGDILYGLGVNYTIEEVDEDHTIINKD